jgi:hypothetical protein
MPEPMSMQQLRDMTHNLYADREFWVDDQGLLRNKEGSWGGRLARNIKIATGEARGAKQASYRQAKEHVLESLINLYGKEIGHKAFRAGVGRARADGGWETSANHPLTGRHVKRMLDAAESLRNAAFAGWLAEKQGHAGEKTPLIERQRSLVASRDGVPDFEQVAQGIREAIGEGRDAGLWLVTLSQADGGKQELGVHYDPQHPERVELRDADGQPHLVPLGNLGAWLQQAGGDGVSRTSLHEVKVIEAPDPPRLEFRREDRRLVAQVEQLIPDGHWEDLAESYKLGWAPRPRPEPDILPTAGWRDLTLTEREGLDRVLDTATFERVHQVISGKLGALAPQPESVEVAVDRDAEGDLVLTFRAPLPRDAVVSAPGERRWGDEFDLALRLKVPNDAIGSDRPKVEFGPLTIEERRTAVREARHHLAIDQYDRATAGWLLLAHGGERNPMIEQIREAMERADEHLAFDGEPVNQSLVLQGRMETGDAARAIAKELNDRLDESERQLWQLKVGIDNGVTTTWGITVDRREPGLVRLFDPSRGQFDVPREQLDDWLAANLDVHYPGQLQRWSLVQHEAGTAIRDLAEWCKDPDRLQPEPVRLGPPVWRAQDAQAPDWGALVAALQEDAGRQGGAGLWLLPLRTEDGGSEPVGIRFTDGDPPIELRVHGETRSGEPEGLADWLKVLAEENGLQIDGPVRRIS